MSRKGRSSKPLYDKENQVPAENLGAIQEGRTSSFGRRSMFGNITNNARSTNVLSNDSWFQGDAKKKGQRQGSMTKLKSRSMSRTDSESGIGLEEGDCRSQVTSEYLDTKSSSDSAHEISSISDLVSAVPKSDFLDDYPPVPTFTPLSPLPMPMSSMPMSPPLFSPFFPGFLQSPAALSPLPQFDQMPEELKLTAVVEPAGFIRLKLNYNVILDISNNMAVRLQNVSKQSSMTLSSSGKHCAIIHPKGRVLVYEPRIEIQTEDNLSVKNAKVYPRGISFTANNMALVYLLDEAGARSTSDMFHDLYATNIVDTLFDEACSKTQESVEESAVQLERAQYWNTASLLDCWIFNSIFVQQTVDGLVIVERTLENGARISIKASPSNGKLRLDSSFVQVTASLGDESHMFLRSKDRRLHYNGTNSVFMVRNAGHSAGFDEEGELRIF